MNMTRLDKQIAFIVELDKLKHIYRQSVITGTNRHETDAEHSWHMALTAMVLAEHVDGYSIDVAKVMKMALIHDVVEIDAGDTYCYDAAAGKDKLEREQQAADRLFGLLPEDQAVEFRALWEEFEEAVTPEARFAAALDRLQPLLLQYYTEGKSWQDHGVTSDQVRKRNQHTKDISMALGKFVNEVITESIERGYLQK